MLGWFFDNFLSLGFVGTDSDSDCGFCVADGTKRVLPYEQAQSTSNTPEMCIKACSEGKYKFAGVQYGIQCFCGNPAPLLARHKRADTECDMKCPGDSNYMCGGRWKMNVYELSKNCPVPKTVTAAPAVPAAQGSKTPGLLWPKLANLQLTRNVGDF